MNKLKVEDFNLKYTIECGQFFRYKLLEDNSYLVNYGDVLFIVKQEENILFYSKNVKETFIKKFFRLDDDLKKLYKELKKDHYLKQAIKKYKGLRLMRQDPWECLISYLCSSASNIPKIQMNIENLSKHFGEPISCKEHNSFSFPKINSIKDFEKIIDSKTGFRAKYIHKTNEAVNEEFFKKLEKLDYENAKKELTKLFGVGEKIADCVLLFSLDHLEAFPIDTWISKAMKQIYKLETDNYQKIQEFSRDKWGENAGYAQQYIYMMIRNN